MAEGGSPFPRFAVTPRAQTVDDGPGSGGLAVLLLLGSVGLRLLVSLPSLTDQAMIAKGPAALAVR